MADFMKDAAETGAVLDAEAKRIREALGFDAVRIVATAEVGDGLSQAYTGKSGNWHAQYGAMAEVMAEMEESLGAGAYLQIECEEEGD